MSRRAHEDQITNQTVIDHRVFYWKDSCHGVAVERRRWSGGRGNGIRRPAELQLTRTGVKECDGEQGHASDQGERRG